MSQESRLDSFMKQFAQAKREIKKLRKLYPHCAPKEPVSQKEK